MLRGTLVTGRSPVQDTHGSGTYGSEKLRQGKPNIQET